MTDDQDPASVGVMKAVEHELAARGVTFANNYATTPDCCPSRASFQTGQYAHNHGVLTRHPPRGGYQGFAAQPALIGNALPVALQDAGYRTGYIGKYLNGYGIPDYGGLRSPGIRRYIPPGWDRWYVPVDHTEYDMYGYRLNENGRLRTYGTAPRTIRPTSTLARRRRSCVPAPVSPSPSSSPWRRWPRIWRTRSPRDLASAAAIRGRRFATWVASLVAPFPDPPRSTSATSPTSPPSCATRLGSTAPRSASYATKYRSRLESLLAVDDLVRGLVHQLRVTGELDNTYIVFTSDNGFMLGQHRRHGKLVVYEESVRVPLIIRGPGLPAGQVRNQLSANIDLAPTILDAAGTPPRLEMDGISLLPGARDPAAGGNRSLVLEYLAGIARTQPSVRPMGSCMWSTGTGSGSFTT